jgi:hypothetical protein
MRLIGVYQYWLHISTDYIFLVGLNLLLQYTCPLEAVNIKCLKEIQIYLRNVFFEEKMYTLNTNSCVFMLWADLETLFTLFMSIKSCMMISLKYFPPLKPCNNWIDRSQNLHKLTYISQRYRIHVNVPYVYIS